MVLSSPSTVLSLCLASKEFGFHIHTYTHHVHTHIYTHNLLRVKQKSQVIMEYPNRYGS